MILHQHFLLIIVKKDVVTSLVNKKWEMIQGKQVEVKRYVPSSNSPFLQLKDEVVKATLECPCKADKFVPFSFFPFLHYYYYYYYYHHFITFFIFFRFRISHDM